MEGVDHSGPSEVVDLEPSLVQAVQVGSAVVADHSRYPWQQPSFAVVVSHACIALDRHAELAEPVALGVVAERLRVVLRARA